MTSYTCRGPTGGWSGDRLAVTSGVLRCGSIFCTSVRDLFPLSLSRAAFPFSIFCFLFPVCVSRRFVVICHPSSATVTATAATAAVTQRHTPLPLFCIALPRAHNSRSTLTARTLYDAAR
ncbi:hypothetical protein AcV7_002485 [Taiwanofungus camphoratus]|nr:hypothetical protein AcV7_002485 [Antrodia cinnamomea]